MDAMQDLRRLIVMRHAKAGELPGGPDFERALRPRGLRESAAAGRWLAGHDFRPDAVICSAARRTRQTWQYVAAELGGAIPVSTQRELYQADADDLMEIIRQTAAGVRSLLYIGHNPAAAGLIAILTAAEPEFPPAAIAVVDLAGDWASLSAGGGTLAASWAPRAAD
jgi:phosphohistidine phosphatase